MIGFNTNKLTINIDLGAAYGTAKSGIGISTMGVLKPDLIVKSVVPVVMAGILGIYGLIISVILLQKSKCLKLSIYLVEFSESYTMYDGFQHLSSGICCGFSSLVSTKLSLSHFRLPDMPLE